MIVKKINVLQDDYIFHSIFRSFRFTNVRKFKSCQFIDSKCKYVGNDVISTIGIIFSMPRALWEQTFLMSSDEIQSTLVVMRHLKFVRDLILTRVFPLFPFQFKFHAICGKSRIAGTCFWGEGGWYRWNYRFRHAMPFNSVAQAICQDVLSQCFIVAERRFRNSSLENVSLDQLKD